MEEQQFYISLVKRFTDRTATDEELEVFIELLNAGKLDKYLQDSFEQDAGITEEHKRNFTMLVKKGRLWPRIVAAASIIIMLSAGGYYVLSRRTSTEQTAAFKQDLRPGTNGAILTLANGKKIVLEQAKVGTIAEGIEKSNDSVLTYTSGEAIGYNILETPRGRQYTVILPDGSKAWLNAGTRLKYPTHFEKNRVVELDGEAYFEVTHDPKMPFRVKSNHQVTEDIGTSFNIKSYGDESAATTTLIEGAITVNKVLLKPGQSAILGGNGEIQLKVLDNSNVIAWKNGFFSYKKASVDEVMRQFARWYDVEVIYESGIPRGSITGSVYRNVNASKALQILGYLNIHYRIEGKKIIITQ